MLKQLLLPCLLLLCQPLFAQKSKSKPSGKTPAAAIVNLMDAIAQKLITVNIEGMGGYEGESLKLNCTNLKGQALRIRIPQGQLMEPADPGMQTLVVSEARTLAVGNRQAATAQLKTFCTQAGDRSPTSGMAFSVGAMAPEMLCQLLKYLYTNGKIDAPDAQSAVWCVTDNHRVSGISDAELARFMADLLGQKPPQYRVHYERRDVPGERAQAGKALVVESNFEYTLTKTEQLSTLLLDSAGKLVKTLRENETAVAGEHHSGLKLQVWNLPPGKYTVRVQTAAARVIQDIEVEF